MTALKIGIPTAIVATGALTYANRNKIKDWLDPVKKAQKLDKVWKDAQDKTDEIAKGIVVKGMGYVPKEVHNSTVNDLEKERLDSFQKKHEMGRHRTNVGSSSDDPYEHFRNMNKRVNRDDKQFSEAITSQYTPEQLKAEKKKQLLKKLAIAGTAVAIAGAGYYGTKNREAIGKFLKDPALSITNKLNAKEKQLLDKFKLHSHEALKQEATTMPKLVALNRIEEKLGLPKTTLPTNPSVVHVPAGSESYSVKRVNQGAPIKPKTSAKPKMSGGIPIGMSHNQKVAHEVEVRINSAAKRNESMHKFFNKEQTGEPSFVQPYHIEKEMKGRSTIKPTYYHSRFYNALDKAHDEWSNNSPTLNRGFYSREIPYESHNSILNTSGYQGYVSHDDQGIETSDYDKAYKGKNPTRETALKNIDKAEQDNDFKEVKKLNKIHRDIDAERKHKSATSPDYSTYAGGVGNMFMPNPQNNVQPLRFRTLSPHYKKSYPSTPASGMYHPQSKYAGYMPAERKDTSGNTRMNRVDHRKQKIREALEIHSVAKVKQMIRDRKLSEILHLGEMLCSRY
jgi:hypothetical protein